MVRNVYFVTKAEDREDAIAAVESWLEDFAEREFYDSFEVDETDVKRVWELPETYFSEALQKVDVELEYYKKSLAEYEAMGNKHQAGWCHVRIGQIFMETFCQDMPFWNMDSCGWELPDKDDWAVMVSLHY
jgi:hypothetical protein